MKIELATSTDVTELVLLVNRAYRGDSSRKGWTTEADLLDGIRIHESGLLKTMEQEGAFVFKCTDEKDRIVGCVLLEQMKDSLYLGMLTVDPSLQGSGIGKKLLAKGDAFAREKGIKQLEMTVISVRTELILWYESKGYTNTGTTKPFPMNDPEFGLPKMPLEFIVMKKILED